jgi:hypothetical protein
LSVSVINWFARGSFRTKDKALRPYEPISQQLWDRQLVAKRCVLSGEHGLLIFYFVKVWM